ncbi:glucans biosynthesis glucosyltransferase MdoH [Roseomonas marmotae]|uniref:Glucans biosynthesis glucosyltransferase H n=1 Tax=Roseomonas marmotae TaxID=2768161 RepID=A0ABS3KBB6_9PROT|nr:glucans biosynthesis glucosyltransferase MdoH [Roseomonas marmotae]MBO1074756.1 glucans biosynthesis glucosyltransferase MdoH [Roseomonas marmotae]QTI80733.1 glucans biosynthesis glucosyltransferase MdoH [Roseomonas marmotae]
MDGVSTTEQARPRTAWRALPPEAPLEMPVQSLRARPARRAGGLPSRPMASWLRRLLVIGGAILLTLFAAREMSLVLNSGKPTVLEGVVLVLFVVLFAWIALSFVSALCGFVRLLLGPDRRLGIAPDGPPPMPSGITALLMPTYNEDPSRVMAGLQAIHASLTTAGAMDRFHIFILSDSTDPAAWIAEEAAFLDLRRRTGDEEHIFYRRRPKNTERKAGNIAEWVRRWGAAYPQMLILDADSVMEADTILRLADAMERHEDVGLIQTLPIITGGSTLFARMQQFAGRVYGPLIAEGIAWWHGAEGNYWGHNAIIRTEAFASAAGLPELRGRKPWGGHIMSHDFVEAALMRRAGWAIHMVPWLRGSYEESPPSLMDLAVRDRRWCQGNLQHMAVLPTRGLHWVSRLHLMTGIGSYITAPIWLLFLIAGVLLSLQSRFIRPEYFPAGPSLFPEWPTVDPVRAMWLFIGTMSLLLAPKLMSWIALLFHPRDRRGCGGAFRTLISMLLETVIAGLMAPVTMLTQSNDVLSILMGRDSGWSAQRRDDGSMPFGEIVKLYWRHTVFGLGFGVIAWMVSPYLALWMSPVVLGLALAIPLAALTARRDIGMGLRRIGLLLVPEETETPRVLTDALAFRRQRADAPALPGPAALFREPALLEAHRRMLPAPRRPRQDPFDPALLVGLAKAEEAESLEEALRGLNRAELAAVLGDARGLSRLSALSSAG